MIEHTTEWIAGAKGIFIYWVIYVVVGFLIVCLTTIIIFSINRAVNSQDEKDEVSNIAIILWFILIPITIGPVTYYVLDYYDINLNTRVIEITSTEKIDLSVKQMEEKATSLSSLLASPEKLTLGEVSTAIEETLRLTSQLQGYSESQAKAIINLQSELESERQKAAEAQQLAKQVQSITREQLDAVKLIITEDARKQSRDSFYLGLVLSFPLGLVASLVATFLYRRFGTYINNKPPNFAKKILDFGKELIAS